MQCLNLVKKWILPDSFMSWLKLPFRCAMAYRFLRLNSQRKMQCISYTFVFNMISRISRFVVPFFLSQVLSQSSPCVEFPAAISWLGLVFRTSRPDVFFISKTFPTFESGWKSNPTPRPVPMFFEKWEGWEISGSMFWFTSRRGAPAGALVDARSEVFRSPVLCLQKAGVMLSESRPNVNPKSLRADPIPKIVITPEVLSYMFRKLQFPECHRRRAN